MHILRVFDMLKLKIPQSVLFNLVIFRAIHSRFSSLYRTFAKQNIFSMMDNKDYNRIKVALVEQKKTARWLSDALGKDPATISKWCTNTTQPSLEMLFKISELLQVPIQDLVRKQNF